MTINIMNFKGHILVGHVLPALPLYLFGLYNFLRCFRIAFYANGPAQSGIAKYVPLLRMLGFLLTGIIYGGIHYFIIVLECDGDGRCEMRNWTHFFIGVSIAFAGLLNWIMTKPIMEMLTVDYSLPIGLSGVGIALAFHLEHSSQSNQIHLTFALSMVITGIMIGVASKWERWTLLSATSSIWSSLLLSASSDEIIEACENDFGAGNLTMLCLFIALSHTVFFGLYATIISNPRLIKMQEAGERLHELNEKELEKLY